ncbi:hypothetical protein [Pseudomonas sp. PDM31]|uniref:hypothetical protein n=1 Tax=Pseudomonas sp. PDM31 TaxID=2854778 RepID=UPI00210C287F|nr:hypothetical protein [Pseudomonas sp. PDM31]
MGCSRSQPEDIRYLADFRENVPFIDKDAIRSFRDRHGDPYGGLACAGPPKLRGVGFTSGTTGDPTPLPRSDYHVALEHYQQNTGDELREVFSSYGGVVFGGEQVNPHCRQVV